MNVVVLKQVGLRIVFFSRASCTGRFY